MIIEFCMVKFKDDINLLTLYMVVWKLDPESSGCMHKLEENISQEKLEGAYWEAVLI
jgi:hypothetical protein